jgi:hypothetical protein
MGRAIGLLLAKHYTSIFPDKDIPNSILDYGCGQSSTIDDIGQYLDIPKENRYKYDWAIPGIDKFPNKKVDVWICTDVLEHIPEEELPEVMRELKSLGGMGYVVVHTGKALNSLPNGENAHCTIWNKEEWNSYIKKYFPVVIGIPSIAVNRGDNTATFIVLSSAKHK